MSNSGDLLRLLMPAVSPVPTRDAPRSDAQPIESRSFESLLDDANRVEADQPVGRMEGADQDSGTDPKGPRQVLAGLSGIDSIQNASLRQIVADAAGRQ